MVRRTIFIASIIQCLVISPLARRNASGIHSIQRVHNLKYHQAGCICLKDVKVHIHFHANMHIWQGRTDMVLQILLFPLSIN
ncbi:hypothetical protein VNO78_05727 [Psophocarpus tetragonolobus]|uniref:Secreted protein n=1 Tax=Psophocarpus tetragonolobus TaxID=3891 RepID=A0AAN9XQZ2_PSOTE